MKCERDLEKLCETNVEKLIECARRRGDPGSALKAHLRVCERCLDRWDAEQELSANLRLMRMETSSLRSSSAARLSLMQQFDSRQSSVRHPWWYTGFAIAAAVLVAVFLGPAALTRLHPPHSAAIAVTDSAEIQADPDADGFIAVPYAPPLATGELVRVVHTDLNPAALASLGVSVDPSWTTQLPADLLEGEDGMPRAVRVSEVDLSEGGF